MRDYQIELTGIRPLLMHADNIEWQDQLSAWRSVPENKKLSVAGDDRSPPHTWKGYVYHDGEHIVIPYDNIRSCLLGAGKKVPKAKGRGSMKAEAVSAIVLESMYIDLVVNKSVIDWSDVESISGDFSSHIAAARKLGFDLFVKRARVGQNKHVRVRPIFNKWSLSFAITVLDETLTTDVLNDLFRVAGKYCGIGDWRPSAEKSPGPYGMFEAKVTQI